MNTLKKHGEYIYCDAAVAEKDMSIIAERGSLPDHMKNSLNLWKDEQYDYVTTRVAINVNRIDSIYDKGHGILCVTTENASYDVLSGIEEFVERISV